MTLLAFLPIALLHLAAPAARASGGDDALHYYNEESGADERFEWSRVQTASRRGESLRRAPASVEVITAEDVRASGAVNLWDLLRFRAGLDVEDAQSDGLAVVSIRGFARSTIRQLQVLIDGRSVYSPLKSAVNWEQLPVQLQDIERIEIVRGPNAVLYGSNSAVGVVNIITKSPDARARVSAGGAAGSRGLLRSEAAAQESLGRFHYRVSQTHLSSNDAPQAGDFLFSNKENFRGRWDLRPGTAVDLFAGGSWDTLGGQDGQQSRYRQHFEMARLTRETGPGALEVWGSRSEAETEQERAIGPRSIREFQYDGEASYRFGWLDERMQTVAGAGYRLAVAESDQVFAGDPKQQNRVRRAFLNQSVRLTDSFTLTGGGSFENSDTGGTEPAYQAAGVLEAAKDQFLRASWSMAPTLPSLYDEHANSRESATRVRVGNPGLDSDRLRNYELGYQGLFRRRLMVDVSLFYLDHQNLNESYVVRRSGGVTTSSVANENRALARGAEAALELKLGAGRSVYANYTYESTTDHNGNLELTRGTPAHKFNAGGRAELPRGVSISANLGYKDAYAVGTPTSGFQDVPAYWRLDARLGWRPVPRLELFLAGQNLTQAYHSEEFQNGGAIPRTYQGGLTVSFP